MARSSVDLGKSPFMPPALAAFLRRRSLAAVRLLALLLSLPTHSSLDPSANRAATGPVHNWLGATGAEASDWLLQMLGIAGIVPALVFSARGWDLIAQRA